MTAVTTRRVAVVTGASSGIGAATARALAEHGWEVVLGARRADRLADVAASIGARHHVLDVADQASVDAFCAALGGVDLLVNNAGAALGIERIEGASDELWRRMYELNVLGVLRMTRALLPKLRAARGQVVIVASTSGFEVYAGGAGYTASKHALRALVRTLRLELLGEPVRVSEISPGMVETEFSQVRFGGDAARAKAVYRGLQPLAPEDVAACIVFAASQPPHVSIDELVVRPLDQATATQVHRRADDRVE
jgi:NADP-dependent 3-hydroxy acid dehydrogenase YdfG